LSCCLRQVWGVLWCLDGLKPLRLFLFCRCNLACCVLEANEGRVTSEADHLLHFVWVWVVTPIVIP
jgi:hypothetical protein